MPANDPPYGRGEEIRCQRAWLAPRWIFFGQYQTDFPERPQHRITGPITERCEFQLVDRLGIDPLVYTVFFAPDMQTLIGAGRGFQDQHFGATEPAYVSFVGVRQ